MKAGIEGCRSAAGAWLATMVLLWMLASASLPVRAQDTAAGPQRLAAPVLVVGSKRFTESYILGEILRRTAESAGEATVRHEQGLGNTGIVQAALASGAIDLYVEYTGTLAREILRLDDPQDATAMARALGQRGLAMSRPLGFNNTYALAMQERQADRLGIARISDLAGHPSLRLGLTQEFIGRADGWPGLRSRYALPFDTPRGMEHGLKFGALAAGQLDVIDVYSTDAAIARNGLRVLQDDRDHFPRYDAVVLYRAGLEGRLPGTWAAIAALEGRLDDATMRALNARAEAGGESFAAIAEQFLSDHQPLGRGLLEQGHRRLVRISAVHQAADPCTSCQSPVDGQRRRTLHRCCRHRVALLVAVATRSRVSRSQQSQSRPQAGLRPQCRSRW